jgi:hypothetical protein
MLSGFVSILLKYMGIFSMQADNDQNVAGGLILAET